MILSVASDRFGRFADEIVDMHRLRYRIFKERLDWDVTVSGGLEIDEYDALRPVYLLHRDEDGRITGTVRLLPTTGPYMLRNSFPVLLGPGGAPRHPRLWEASRFAVDGASATLLRRGLSLATFELFAAIVEFGIARDLLEIVAVVDARMERILRRAGWPLRRIAKGRSIDATVAVAGFLEVSPQALDRIRDLGGLCGPVLAAPVWLKETA